jgi:gas vesicle protein
MLIGLIIGLVVGIVIVLLIQQPKINELKQQLEERKKEVQNWEETHETRLREMRASLESDNQKKIDQAIAELTEKHQAEVKALEAQQNITDKAIIDDIETTESAPILEQLATENQEIQEVPETTSELIEEIEELTEAKAEETTVNQEPNLTDEIEVSETTSEEIQEVPETTSELIEEIEELTEVKAEETTVNQELNLTSETEIPETTSEEIQEIPETTSELIEEIEELTEVKAEETTVNQEPNLTFETEIPETTSELIEEIEELTEVKTVVSSEEIVTEPSSSLQPTIDLSNKILALGNSGKSASLLQLKNYLYHDDVQIRSLVAIAIGNIAESCSIQGQIQPTLFMLEKLSKDPNSLVRYYAIEAIDKIKSERVIPLLQIALKDTDPEVVKCASKILNRFKGYQLTQKKPVTKVNSQKVKR